MKNFLLFFLLIIISFQPLYAQENKDIFKNKDTTTYIDPSTDKRYKTKLGRSLIVPAIIIGYGLTTIKNNGLYSSYALHKDLEKTIVKFGKSSIRRMDDIMIFAPYVELGILNLLKIRCKNDWLNTGLLFLKSEIIMLAITFPMKSLTNQMRPYAYDSVQAANAAGIEFDEVAYKKTHPNAFHSLPSGHTAQAFVAASIVHKEFRSKSNWYGVGAYTIAATVAAFRILNNRHWMSDVMVGAGIGIASVHIAYATHKFKWGRKEICVIPTYYRDMKGLAMVYSF